MILATQKCGCPAKKAKPPCSPCCEVKKQITERPPPKINDVSACCPTNPADEFQRPCNIRSEIVERGLPYKEIEAIINNNRVVIRTQTEPGKVEYEPPCDCNEDPRAAPQPDEAPPAAGNRTVTLYPRPQMEAQNANMGRQYRGKRLIDQEENPNIFLLRVKKMISTGEKKCNMDLEFKTHRPWSTKKRKELCEEILNEHRTATISEAKQAEEKKAPKKREASSKHKKKTKDERVAGRK